MCNIPSLSTSKCLHPNYLTNPANRLGLTFLFQVLLELTRYTFWKKSHPLSIYYVVSMTKAWMTPALLPFLVFIIAMFISFATVTSWCMIAILTTIATPLLSSIGGTFLLHFI